MKPEELLSVLHTANRLKDTTRHCWTPGNRHESVADHSWRLALTAFFLRDEFPETDMDKVIKICLLYTSPSPRDYAASRMPSSA